MKVITLYLVLLLWGTLARAEDDQLINLPNRPANALSGSAFMKKIARLDGGARETAMVAEILKGNIPSFLRRLTPIDTKLTAGIYRGQTLRYYALPDYLAVGSDEDYVRVPLNLYSVEKLSEQLDLSLPTVKMVDDIYAHAKQKFAPQPVVNKLKISSTSNIQTHNDMLKAQFGERYHAGELTAGHKKDVVQSRRILRKPGSIAIYGWHRNSESPIQPLSTAHSADYADYSHGIRLVSNLVKIGQQTLDLRDILENKNQASPLSYEGTIPQMARMKSQNRTGLAFVTRP
ncbi:MAG: hypothetical protein EOP10_19675 [Proteobacteria bacterium]|nr:MAG: hypothetical protein EOP10_19675 [Pseudomonadota bacterium]